MFNSDLNRFADWLHEKRLSWMFVWSPPGSIGCLCSTSWKSGASGVIIANPKWVKAVKGNKDDTKDSKWIGDLFRIGLVKKQLYPGQGYPHPPRVDPLPL
ncbi:MAG: hypothetical protein ACLRWQ_07835 [Flavonifractor plautii]